MRMVLFSLVAIPLGAALILTISGERGSFWSPIVRGAIWYLPLFVFVMIVRFNLPLQYDGPGLFRYFLIRDFLLSYVGAIVGFLVLYRRIILEDDRAMVFLCTLFCASLLTAVTGAEIVLEDGAYTAYRQLVLPMQRTAVVILLPVLFGAILRESRILLRIGYASLVVLLPAFFAVSPLLFFLQFRAAGVAVGVAAALLASATGVLLRRAYYPDRGFVSIPEAEEGAEPARPFSNATIVRTSRF